MQIKVCGITDIFQLKELNDLSITYAGFIFYPPSPRHVNNFLQADGIKNFNGKIKKVGVFVNADFQEVINTIHKWDLSTVQLHGEESPSYAKKLMPYATVIKTIHVAENILNTDIELYKDAVDILLFDTKTEAYGGSGKKFNWEMIKNKKIKKPYLLSGGIEIGDAAALEIIASQKNFFLGCDLNSRFEIKPGLKNMPKIAEFCKQLQL